jgi:hypothetical protein
MKTALTAVAAFTALATVYLSLSLAILQPPNADISRWSWLAVVFLLQGALTLGAVAGRLPWQLRWFLLVGGATILLIGASAIYTTATGAHFEGYALVLGTALVIQGLLTLLIFGKIPQRLDLV